MKKILIFIYLITQFSSILAQEYVPFPMENALWVDYLQTIGSNDVPYYTYSQISINNIDTVINGMVYKKIDKKGLRYNNNIVAIREKDKIIYLREDNKDTILYDFNIRVKDTLNGRFYGFKPLPFNLITVKSIDSILIDNKFRKRYHLYVDGAFAGHLIEGIGCNCGFLPYVRRLESGGQLACHSINDRTVYEGNNGKCDLVSNKEVIKNLEQVQIYPNPVVDKSFLKMPDDMSIDRATVYDVLGRTVKSYDMAHSLPEIFKKDYSKGIYFVHVFHQKQLIALSKFIVD